MNFDKDYDPITNIDLINLEKLIEAKLPEDYKKHMLKYNGGSIPLNRKYSFEYNNQFINLSGFDDIDTVIIQYNYKHSFLYPKLLTIGTITGGYLALAYTTENKGEIHLYYSDGIPEKVADSFTEFIENLEEDGAF